MNSPHSRRQLVEIAGPEIKIALSFIPHFAASRIILGIALAGTRVMNRMSVEGDGVRAGGVTVALLDDESPSPGLCGGWRRECRGD
jgi:hypothetical protein